MFDRVDRLVLMLIRPEAYETLVFLYTFGVFSLFVSFYLVEHPTPLNRHKFTCVVSAVVGSLFTFVAFFISMIIFAARIT